MAYKIGSRGEDVKIIQQDLIAAGLGHLLGPKQDDGEFGKRTRAAVAAFQVKYKLSSTGIVDSQTFRKLEEIALAAELKAKKPSHPEPEQAQALPEPPTRVLSDPDLSKPITVSSPLPVEGSLAPIKIDNVPSNLVSLLPEQDKPESPTRILSNPDLSMPIAITPPLASVGLLAPIKIDPVPRNLVSPLAIAPKISRGGGSGLMLNHHCLTMVACGIESLPWPLLS